MDSRIAVIGRAAWHSWGVWWGGAVAPTGPGGSVTSIGNFSSQTLATRAFRTAHLNSPDTSPYAFTGLYGAQIARLAYRLGPGGLLFRRGTGTASEAWLADGNGPGARNLLLAAAAGRLSTGRDHLAEC